MSESILNFLQQNATDIAWIIVLFFFGKSILKLAVNRLRRVVDDGDDVSVSQNEKRVETLGHIILTTGNVFIYAILLFLILSLLGVDMTPILAGAGVIGLAVGFGAQSIVKDFVSGLFILLEDQYGIGDQIKVGTFEGRVKKITMRSTMLEDDEGNVYFISNGSIKDVVNRSQKKPA